MKKLIEKDKKIIKMRGVPLPDGWNIYTLYETRDKGDRFSFTGGPFGSDLKTEHYTEKGVRVIQLQNIGDGKFLEDYKIYTSEKKADELFSCNIFPGDIIISKMAEPLARACTIPNTDNRFVMASDGIRLKVDEKRFDAQFILYFINSWFFRKEAIKKGTGTTRLRIGLSDLKNIKIMAPNIKEQKAISKIISLWDKAIELKEKLIEQKKELKKGLMQKLLTGEIRLPGFKGEWRYIKLGDVIEECIERTSKNNQFPVLTSSRQGIFLQEEYFSKQVASKDNTGYKVVRKGDFTYRTMSDDGYFVFNRLENYKVGIVSPAYVVFRAKNINPIFLKEFINSHMFRRYMIKNIQGGTRVSYKYKDLHNTFVKIPSHKEQKEIAEVIKNIKRNIELLEEELRILKLQKKGLMQLLLTGKVRVKV